jgi:hypothetical protein
MMEEGFRMAMWRGRADSAYDTWSWLWCVHKIDSFFERNKKDTLALTCAWTELKRQVFGFQSEGNSITSANALATLQRMSVKDMQRLDAVRLREFCSLTWRWHEVASATLAARVNPDGRRLQ